MRLRTSFDSQIAQPLAVHRCFDGAQMCIAKTRSLVPVEFAFPFGAEKESEESFSFVAKSVAQSHRVLFFEVAATLLSHESACKFG